MQPPSAAASAPHAKRLAPLALAALGVAFGDIGTSPLYAFKEAAGEAGVAHVFGLLSMIFWAVMLVVSAKYVSFVLRFDNHGEGGVLALLANAGRITQSNPRLHSAATAIALAAVSLFFGDAFITPAISVLSAVEGLAVAEPELASMVVPVTVAILIGLFALQKRGTGGIGRLFGPVTVVWMLVMAVLGMASIVQTPAILGALDPRHAAAFAVSAPGTAFIALGAVFLALTGAEALYADMGHFGRVPIRLAWFGLVLPALMLNYLGQGALVLREPEAMANPFFRLAPDALVFPLVVLATFATVIASQATISGAFSATQQAFRLGFLPTLPTRHTSESEQGQIYIPIVNFAMLVIVVLVVLGFGSSSKLAAAYGIAVSTTLFLETLLVGIVVWAMWPRLRVPVLAGLAVVGVVELMFVASNAMKIAAGGWFPIACGAAIFTMLATWRRGSDVIARDKRRKSVSMQGFFGALGDVPTVPGDAVFLSGDPHQVPVALMHNLKHNKVLHERLFFVTFSTEDSPYVPREDRLVLHVLEPGKAFHCTFRYGFMEAPSMAQSLALLKERGLELEMANTTFFLGRSTIDAPARASAFTWRRTLFRWMQRNAPSPIEYLGIPADRAIELGTRISL